MTWSEVARALLMTNVVTALRTEDKYCLTFSSDAALGGLDKLSFGARCSTFAVKDSEGVEVSSKDVLAATASERIALDVDRVASFRSDLGFCCEVLMYDFDSRCFSFCTVADFGTSDEVMLDESAFSVALAPLFRIGGGGGGGGIIDFK